MSSFVVNPRGIDMLRWAGQMALSLSAYGNVPVLTDPAHWRTWAGVVVAIPAVAAVGAPRPEPFNDWRQWAEQFNLSLRLLT